MLIRDKPLGPIRRRLLHDTDDGDEEVDHTVGDLSGEEEKNLADMVKNWKEGQTAEAEQRMVRNYVTTMTNLSDSEVDELISKHNL